MARDMIEKTCRICGKSKSIAEFSIRRGRGDGFAGRCKPCVVIAAREWYEKNKDKKRAYDEKRREEKRHLYRAASKRWRDSNREKKRADTNCRRRRLRERMPQWVSPKDMMCFYEQAQRVSKCLGTAHHVDHIAPIAGDNFSGLHVPWNLQVIPAPENLKKHNKYGA